jgi:uncharacterized iron-regulated membrane protein
MTEHQSRIARHKRRTVGVFLHRIHRWIGVIVSLFVVFLVITGWALNHTAELGLARLSVHTPWITAWYGLPGEVPATGYTASGHWLIATQNDALLDGKPIPAKLSGAIGISVTNEFVAIANRDRLILLDTQGRIVDDLSGKQLPGNPISAIGSAQNKIVLRAETDYASSDGATWAPFTGEASWSTAQSLPPTQQAHAKQLAPALPLERIVQDLHSGRILGHFGPYLMDAVGLLLLLLAASGLWMFIRRRR